METIKGKVEKYNKSNGRPSGILVNGTWYNSSDATEEAIAGLKSQLGAMVEFVHEKKVIAVIKVLSAPESSPRPAYGRTGSYTQHNSRHDAVQLDVLDENRVIIRQSCAKMAVDYFKEEQPEANDLVSFAETIEAWIYRPVGMSFTSKKEDQARPPAKEEQQKPAPMSARKAEEHTAGSDKFEAVHENIGDDKKERKYTFNNSPPEGPHAQ